MMIAWAWVALAAVAGFASAAFFAGGLGLDRDRFVAVHLVVVLLVAVGFARSAGIHPMVQLRRRWIPGVVGGIVVGALLARTVVSQPGSPAPEGLSLAAGLVWLGLVYGVADAVLLSVLPVLALYGLEAATAGSAAARLRLGMIALAGSLVVTAAYHLGFPEYRGAGLSAPLVGNAVITAGYLATGSPIAPILSHVVMHLAAVLHGPATTSQLPPHL